MFSSLDSVDIVLKPDPAGRRHYIQTDHRTADEIATGEHAGNSGHLILVHDHAAPFIYVDFVGITGGENWDRIESVSNQDDIDWQTEFRTGNSSWLSAAFRVGFPQFHSYTARFANFAGVA